LTNHYFCSKLFDGLRGQFSHNHICQRWSAKQWLLQLQSVHAKQKILNWMGQLFGNQRSHRVNNVQRRGRHLWILKDKAIRKLNVCCPYYFNVVLKAFLFLRSSAANGSQFWYIWKGKSREFDPYRIYSQVSYRWII
jgi:hypothetical protein